MRLKRWLLIVAVFWTALSPVAIIGIIETRASAEDAVCLSGQIIAVGRRRWCGYFKNERNTGGSGFGAQVRAAGIPGSVNSADEFIQLIKDDLGSGNAHRITGAQFLVLTMIQRPPGPPQSVSAAQLAEWEARVRSYASTSENGSSSFGPNGRIDWFVSQHMDCNSPQNINTFYQIQENDVAPFLNTASNSECEKPWIMEAFVVFRDAAGTPLYTIRRICMNPMGNIIGVQEQPQLDYELRPTIIATVNGNPISGAAEVGDNVQFQYQITNDGDDNSPSANCNIYGNTHPGFFSTPSPPTSSSSGGYSPPPTGCPRVFDAHVITPINSEGFTVGASNQTICRSLFVSPSTPTVPSLGTEVCIPVGTKPYVRAFGGDVSAGNSLIDNGGACTPNNNAAIVGWNKRSGGNFAGAATQYGGFALASINDFATSLGNGGASAAAPIGLSFANANANPPGGNFGGTFGSVPCIVNHAATNPGGGSALPPAISDITASGVYQKTGTGNLGGGQADAGERILIYIEGDVLITGNITYAGSFTSANTPLLRMVVSGNIFIDNDVTRLDGIYIAQKTTSDNGVIHTCATSTIPLVPGGSLFGLCNKKLIVNGVFIADQVRLLRTFGSLSQSNATETSAANAAGEVFNFGPAIWMAQPLGEGGTADYDAITSLPPIL